MADTSTSSPPTAASDPKPDSARPPLHSVLPPLILGTATFNTQYVADPHSMPYRDVVARAIQLGIKAFDTSPYYGPSETLLGTALSELMSPVPSESDPNPVPLSRADVFLISKAGRVASSEFDYSPAWIRYSVLRSLQRLRTPYLDLVYTHDVEFVSPPEVLAAVRELRRLRDEEGIVRYVGISGFPLEVLCDLAEMIYRETGEPLDAVMSFGHFTVQNRTLGLPWLEQGDGAGKVQGSPLARLKKAGVDVVPNASILNMGLLTSRGIPVDPQVSSPSASGSEADETASQLAQWHPSPPGLRLTCKKLADLAAAAGERLESVAIRWSLAEWARVGAEAGVGIDFSIPGIVGTRKLGVTVCAVQSVSELEEIVAEWRGVLSTCDQAKGSNGEAYDAERQVKIANLVRKEFWPALGSWLDYAWESPRPGFVNSRRESDRGVIPDDGVVTAYENARKGTQGAQSAQQIR
ncbi:hypothetical protein VTK56DRAFT_4501 [Thermocarpiscus australiensis]